MPTRKPYGPSYYQVEQALNILEGAGLVTWSSMQTDEGITVHADFVYRQAAVDFDDVDYFIGTRDNQ